MTARSRTPWSARSTLSEGGLPMALQSLQRVDKPWGYELLWARTDGYAAKILHINGGHRLSLQYHRQKEETIFLQSGRMFFLIENQRGELRGVSLAAGSARRAAAAPRTPATPTQDRLV